MANKYAGHGGEYRPTESLEDTVFQAIAGGINNAMASTPPPPPHAPTPTANGVQPPPTSCAIPPERAQLEADNLAYVGFDIITLMMLGLALFIVFKTLKCILSLRVVRATKPHQQ
jgi:hypothetical protein